MTVEPCVAIDVAHLTMNFNRCYTLCIQKLYHRSHFIVVEYWNKSLHLQPLQRCYCGNLVNPASACVLRRHYSITYTQSLHAIKGLIVEGRVGNLLCGRLSYSTSCVFSIGSFITLYSTMRGNPDEFYFFSFYFQSVIQ